MITFRPRRFSPIVNRIPGPVAAPEADTWDRDGDLPLEDVRFHGVDASGNEWILLGST